MNSPLFKNYNALKALKLDYKVRISWNWQLTDWKPHAWNGQQEEKCH